MQRQALKQLKALSRCGHLQVQSALAEQLLHHPSSSFASQAVPPATAQLNKQRGGREGWGWVMLLPAALAAYLGYWQTERYFWKVDLLENRRAGTQEPAKQLTELASAPREHAKLAVSGKFQHEKSVYVGPRPKTISGTATTGYQIITPLITSEWDRPVLVNRGWVPAQWRTDPQMRASGSTPDVEEVEGFVRVSEPRSMFVPDNEPAREAWYWIDVPQIALACGLPEETPLIEVYSDESLQQAGPAPTSMDVLAFKGRYAQHRALYPMRKSIDELLDVKVTPVDHRNYALTWFSLSAATAFLGARLLRKPVPRTKR